MDLAILPGLAFGVELGLGIISLHGIKSRSIPV